MSAPSESPFACLGVRPDAPDTEVKAAWLLRVQESHPDRLVDAPPDVVEAALERTKRLNAAYAEVKRRRAAGEGPTPRGSGAAGRPGGRPSRAVDEPRTAAEGLHRAERAIEDAQAALSTCETAVRVVRNGLRTIGADRAEWEKRAHEAEAHATKAATLADGLFVSVREATARTLAGDALRAVAQARALAATHRNERQTLLVRASAGATAGLSRLPEARRTAAESLADGAAEVERLVARVRPVARDLAARWGKADEAARRYRGALAALPGVMEPARTAVERAVVAAARARGLVEAEASTAPPDVAAHWRRRAEGFEQVAGTLAARTPPEPPAPPGSPYALPKPEAVLAAAGRLSAANAQAQAAAVRGAAAVRVVSDLRAGGPDAIVAAALAFVDAEIGTLRTIVSGRG